MKKERFNVDGMTCAACQAHVEKATRNVNGVKKVSVNLLNNNMYVTTTNHFHCTLSLLTATTNNE